MKGIILAGGLGTRLRPLTDHVSKGLLPVGGKPLIKYSIKTMVEAGIKEICVVVRPEQATQYALALGNGGDGVSDAHITLKFQQYPNGICGALQEAAWWAGGSNIMVLLGDSIFGHYDFRRDVRRMDHAPFVGPDSFNALIYAAHEKEPSWCAQIEWMEEQNLVPKELHEKPEILISHDVVPGCYLYRNDVWGRIHNLKPSARGELEITDLNRTYLGRDQKLRVHRYTGLWIDAGTDLNAYIKAQSEPNLPTGA